jgi:hypothetical protein
MIDLDDELLAYAREWRAAQPPLPPLASEPVDSLRRRSRWVLLAAALVVVLAVGAIALLATRSDRSTPTIDAPPSTTTGVAAFVPKVDVIPLYLPIDAADTYSAGALRERIGFTTTGNPPPHDELVQQRACDITLLGGGFGNMYGFEDPGNYHGMPVAPSVAPPEAPPSLRCTAAAARAARRIRDIVGTLGWFEQIKTVDDPTVHAAIVQDIVCLNQQGIDRVGNDGYVTDGYNQMHPEQIGQTRLAFADCFAPVVAVRAPLRQAFRTQFLSDHRGEIDSLQAAFDDYLRALYAPPPHAKTVTTEPDVVRLDDGCIRVLNQQGTEVPGYDSDAALAFARRAIGDTTAPTSRSYLGDVTVCDRRAIRGRLAWTFEFPGRVVVIDALNGKVLLDRPVTTG